ncbi:unnamed protein product [Chondrus crispus]|uniref:TraB domain-containing protein n=1 Tax=Chondrus crispus TaxID=2769 RepID=R7QA16_CHOCR|nr:unnamed protein product [Chondrus crispus]CDF34315.1 unnamed protein product [Chondrus crispus]|eukprot:XP_005714134.1 unnamed protein product [Chondrus crispus]
MPHPSFLSPPLPSLRRAHARAAPASPPLCTLPTLSDLTSLGVLTLRPRSTDYKPPPPSARSQLEPELIALVAVSHHPSPSNLSPAYATAAIQRLHPDAVVLELCRFRAPLLNDPPATDTLPPWARLTLRRRLLGTLLASADDDAIAAGAEFRAAAKAAEQVRATLVLGDRPLQHTLSRAWDSLNLRDRFVLAAALARAALAGNTVGHVADEKLKETIESGLDADGVVDKYVRLLGERFPGLRRTLVEERDLYMAWVLKRSRAVSGKKCVVGVVGRAHVDGIVRALEEDDRRRREGEQPLLRFRDIVS